MFRPHSLCDGGIVVVTPREASDPVSTTMWGPHRTLPPASSGLTAPLR